jgi:hypothetical protein
MTRLEANREILALLNDHIEKYPDERFSQILQNIKVNICYRDYAIFLEDEFYLESEKLLERIKKGIK